jgi:mRNA-degrading endonuclease RelE of RelBE toxin-antitoxin system
MTVVETARFIREAGRILTEEALERLLAFLALNPDSGVVVPGSGGIRKVRWAIPGRGKRGGVRVIYYFHNESLPLLALSIYANNDKADITAADAKEMKAEIKNFIKNLTGEKQ